MKETKNPINQRIARYRVLAGYTQETAAEALGMKKNTYARMERYGNPKPEILKKICDLYNVTVDLILYDKPFFSAILEPQEPLILSDHKVPLFPPDPPISLTTNEKNCIKLTRNLSREKRNELLNIINEFCKNNENK